MNESEQAQAIKNRILDIRQRHERTVDISKAQKRDMTSSQTDRQDLLLIVDVQAQKIASATLKLADSEAKRGVLISEIAEQAKEIERMKDYGNLKQYTEKELRTWLEATNLSLTESSLEPWARHIPTHPLLKSENMKYADPRDEAMWFGIYNFARIIGAIKTEKQ